MPFGNIMIILNSKEINTNFKNLLEKYENCLNYGILSCPNCGSDHFIRWGYYLRNVYYINNNNIEFNIIKIQRIRCKTCGHTHALLPTYIIPYRQYLLDAILTAINDDDLSYNYKLSFDTIQKWKYIFHRLFLPYLNTIIFYKKDIIKIILDDIFSIYEKFYFINKKILMMIHHGVLNMAYF